MKEALVLMAKAPRVGEVKTRLLGALTAEEAKDLYVAFLSDTCALMEALAEERETLALVLCYTPADGVEDFESVEREGSLLLAQRGADLGERLHNCFSDLLELGYEAIVIIGGDSPTLPGEFVWEAFEQLNEGADLVLGPAADGGYYLIGLTRLPEGLLAEIPWSTAGVLAATQERARAAGLNVHLLPEWYDVDTPEELEQLREELRDKEVEARFTRKFLKQLAKARS